MATESRTITFTDVEIVRAITSYCVKTGRIASNVRITPPLVANEDEVKFAFDPVPAGARITLGENEMLSALILFCNEHGIPIARRSTKSIQIARRLLAPSDDAALSAHRKLYLSRARPRPISAKICPSLGVTTGSSPASAACRRPPMRS